MKIVIPMAGKGSRFADVADQNLEYKKPKPLINIKGKPMILWALESLPFVELSHRQPQTKFKVTAEDLIFICRQDQQDQFKIGQQLKEIFGPKIHLVFLDKITHGATETALKAKPFINFDEEIIVSDSDHYFDGSFFYKKILEKEKNDFGIIPVWVPLDDEPKWSYALVDNDQNILDVNEKDPILASQGALANIGAYYFASGKEFVMEAEKMIEENDVSGPIGKQEFYLAPIYRRFIKKGKKIKAARTPQVWGLGTPKDVEYFIENVIIN